MKIVKFLRVLGIVLMIGGVIVSVGTEMLEYKLFKHVMEYCFSAMTAGAIMTLSADVRINANRYYS